MLKAGRIQWVLLALCGLLLIPAFVANGVGALLSGVTPTVQAAGRGTRQGDSSKRACTAEHQDPSFGGTVVIGVNEVLCSDLTSFGGTVEIQGEVRGNMLAINSNVVIDGEFNGDVHLYGGTLTLHKGAQLHGNIHLYGGNWHKDSGALFTGQSIDNTWRNGWFFGDSSEFSFPLWSILTWIALGIVLTLVLPEHVTLVRTTAATRMRRSLMVGLLSILLAPAVLVVLIALILPIPLAIIVALGLIAAWALGTVAIGWLVGEQVMRAIAPHRNTRLTQVVVGLAVLTLIGALPYIGSFISIAVGLTGLGAVFLSRFGTRFYGQPKQPLTL